MAKSQITGGTSGGMNTKDIVIYSLLALAIGLGVVAIVFQITNPLAKGDTGSQGPAGPEGPKGDSGADGQLSDAAMSQISSMQSKIDKIAGDLDATNKTLTANMAFLNLKGEQYVKKTAPYYVVSLGDGNVLRNANSAVFEKQSNSTNADRDFQRMQFIDAPPNAF